jgi:hypothetical protein
MAHQHQQQTLVCVLLWWLVVWWIYNLLLRPRVNLLSHDMVSVPRGLDWCSNRHNRTPGPAALNVWSLGHFAIYFTLGLVVHNQYGLVLGFSILCEVYEWIVGYNARWVLDPVVNMLGYCAGQAVPAIRCEPPPSAPRPMQEHVDRRLLLVFVLVLILNQPQFLPTPYDREW